MAEGTWLSAIGHVVSDFFGGAVGGFFSEMVRTKREDVARGIGEVAGKEAKKALLPDREDIMKALLVFRCEAIVELLREMNAGDGVIQVGDNYYYENRVITLLLKVEEKDRQWVFTILNAVCKSDRLKFFTLLEVMRNDGVWQLAALAKRYIADGAKKAGGSIDAGASGLATGLRTFREGLAQHGIKRRGKTINKKPKDPEWDF